MAPLLDDRRWSQRFESQRMKEERPRAEISAGDRRESGHSEAGTESREEIRVYAATRSRRTAACDQSDQSVRRALPRGSEWPLHARRSTAVHNNVADETRTKNNIVVCTRAPDDTREHTQTQNTFTERSNTVITRPSVKV